MSGLSEWISGIIPVQNQFFTGGLGLAALGMAATVGRGGLRTATMLARRHLLITLEVTSKDPAYPWILNWLATQGRRTQHLSVNTVFKKLTDGSTKMLFDFVPGPGRHLIWYGNQFFGVERQRETQMLDFNSGTPWEKVTLTSIGRNAEVFEDLLVEAKNMSLQEETGKTIVYTNWGTEWRQFGHPRRKRPIDSVILQDGLAESILTDVQDWRMSSEWYHGRGIPYRRGYLLHGPPGSGKSSFITALAGHLDYNICMLSLNDAGLTDDRLAHALSVAPQQSLVLLEDIDAAFTAARTVGEHNNSGVTFSGLLNTLDGVASSEERLLFMTTNHIERLERALMRPGRVDKVYMLDDASESQTKKLFTRFYEETADPSLIDTWCSEILSLDTRPSMAEIQGHLLNFKDDPCGAVENIPALAESIVVSRGSGMVGEAAPEAVVDVAQERRRSKKGGRRLSSFEIDKMAFNPQEGWEEQVGFKR